VQLERGLKTLQTTAAAQQKEIEGLKATKDEIESIGYYSSFGEGLRDLIRTEIANHEDPDGAWRR
jgi:hypothetical protein